MKAPLQVRTAPSTDKETEARPRCRTGDQNRPLSRPAKWCHQFCYSGCVWGGHKPRPHAPQAPDSHYVITTWLLPHPHRLLPPLTTPTRGPRPNIMKAPPPDVTVPRAPPPPHKPPVFLLTRSSVPAGHPGRSSVRPHGGHRGGATP
jgi:hypothetical protein